MPVSSSRASQHGRAGFNYRAWLSNRQTAAEPAALTGQSFCSINPSANLPPARSTLICGQHSPRPRPVTHRVARHAGDLSTQLRRVCGAPRALQSSLGQSGRRTRCTHPPLRRHTSTTRRTHPPPRHPTAGHAALTLPRDPNSRTRRTHPPPRHPTAGHAAFTLLGDTAQHDTLHSLVAETHMYSAATDCGVPGRPHHRAAMSRLAPHRARIATWAKPG